MPSSNATDFSFEHVADASTVRPFGGLGDLDDAASSDTEIGAGATAAAACGAATSASSADSAASAVAPGLAFDGRIVGFASVFVQRAGGTMYVAPLRGPTPGSPFSWADNRPYSQEQPPKRARSVSPADATGCPMDVDEPSLGAADTGAPAAAAPAAATGATAAAAPDPRDALTAEGAATAPPDDRCLSPLGAAATSAPADAAPASYTGTAAAADVPSQAPATTVGSHAPAVAATGAEAPAAPGQASYVGPQTFPAALLAVVETWSRTAAAAAAAGAPMPDAACAPQPAPTYAPGAPDVPPAQVHGHRDAGAVGATHDARVEAASAPDTAATPAHGHDHRGADVASTARAEPAGALPSADAAAAPPRRDPGAVAATSAESAATGTTALADSRGSAQPPHASASAPAQGHAHRDTGAVAAASAARVADATAPPARGLMPYGPRHRRGGRRRLDAVSNRGRARVVVHPSLAYSRLGGPPSRRVNAAPGSARGDGACGLDRVVH